RSDSLTSNRYGVTARGVGLSVPLWAMPIAPASKCSHGLARFSGVTQMIALALPRSCCPMVSNQTLPAAMSSLDTNGSAVWNICGNQSRNARATKLLARPDQLTKMRALSIGPACHEQQHGVSDTRPRSPFGKEARNSTRERPVDRLRGAVEACSNCW